MDYFSLIQSSIDLIEKNLSEKLNVNDIANRAFLSKYHFQRLFHSTVGNSIMEYVKKRKLSLAALELCTSKDSILNIALKYGYNSHESFTRAFKLYHGINPMPYVISHAV